MALSAAVSSGKSDHKQLARTSKKPRLHSNACRRRKPIPYASGPIAKVYSHSKFPDVDIEYLANLDSTYYVRIKPNGWLRVIDSEGSTSKGE